MKFFKQKESDTRHIGASGREKEQQKEQEFGQSLQVSFHIVKEHSPFVESWIYLKMGLFSNVN